MDIDDLKIGEAKKLATMFNPGNTSDNDVFEQVGKYYIFRTYSAGVFFGRLVKKHQNECIVSECRRLYYWKTITGGLSLSEVANHGLHIDSKVCETTSGHWIEAIELIPCKQIAINNIQDMENHVS